MTAAWAAMPDDEPLDMREWMQRYALEISGRGACNYDFNLLDKDAVKTPFAAAVTESTKESIARIAEPRPGLHAASRARQARAQAGRTGVTTSVLFSTAEAIVQGRLDTCPLGEQTDLLTRLITVPDPETGEHLDAGCDPRPDPDAPLQRLQRSLDHRRAGWRTCSPRTRRSRRS